MSQRNVPRSNPHSHLVRTQTELRSRMFRKARLLRYLARFHLNFALTPNHNIDAHRCGTQTQTQRHAGACRLKMNKLKRSNAVKSDSVKRVFKNVRAFLRTHVYACINTRTNMHPYNICTSIPSRSLIRRDHISRTCLMQGVHTPMLSFRCVAW